MGLIIWLLANCVSEPAALGICLFEWRACSVKSDASGRRGAEENHHEISSGCFRRPQSCRALLSACTTLGESAKNGLAWTTRASTDSLGKLSVVRQAYSINEALNYALGPVSSLFDTFFSRFEDLEEAPIVPLDAVVGESRSSEQGSNNEAEGEGVGNVENGAETQQTAQAQENTDQSSAWQQAYASHLSKFVDQVDQPVEASLSRPEPPPISDVTEMTPCAAALSTEDNLDQMPRAELISTEGMMHVGDGMDMVDAHEAGAILASLSGLGQTPHFDLTTMLNTDSGGWETAGGNFDELMAFLQMPSLIDVDGMNLDMPDFM